MMRGYIGFLAGAFLAGSLLSAAHAQQRPGDFDGVTVEGTGEVQVKPDIARLTLGVQTQGADSTAAAQENAAATQKVIDAIKGTGIADKDIQTSNYSIYPQYDSRPRPAGDERPPAIVGYQVSNTVQVTVRKVADVGRVIDAAVKAGANVASGINFDVDDPSSAKDEAMRKAVADAMRKAKVIATAANLNNIRLIGILEGSVNIPRPIYPMARGAMAADVATPISVGEQTVTATVTARFSFATDRVDRGR